MTDLTFQPLDLQNGSYSAQQDRLYISALKGGGGVCGPNDFKPSVSGVQVSLNPGSAFIPGGDVVNQGTYQISETNSIIVNVDSNSAGAYPRIDQIVLRVFDKTAIGGAYDKASIEVVKGTPTSGATLDNRSGFSTIPSTSIILADVILNAGSATINGFRDRRKIIDPGSIPSIVTNLTNPAVSFEDPPGIMSEYAQGSVTAAGLSVNDNGKQVAVLQYLPTPIVGATKIRFRYVQGSTAIAAGNYAIAIFDASGRLIQSTGDLSFSGSANSIQNVSATISSTNFEAGLYYVFLGTTGSTASSFINYLGSNPKTAFVPNVCFHATSGGTTVPTTILGLTDSSTIDPVATRIPYVPNIALSVG